jgi:hypothetical protein
LSFDQILSNVTEVLLPFELVDNDGNQNQEHGGLDNVVLAATGLPGDYNKNNAVNAADYVVWRKTDGTQAGYNTWRTNFGRTSATAGLSESAGVPEPASIVFVCLGVPLILAGRWFRSEVRTIQV